MDAPRPRAAASTPWWRTLTADNWFIVSFASLAWLFDCLDQQVFNLSRDAAMETLMGNKAVATEYGGYATSIFLIGWSLGGLLFGALGDRFGRARVLSFTVLLYSVSTGLNALSVGFADFCVYRFVTGFGIGGVFGLSVALIADAVPDEARAPALGLLQSLSTLGTMLAGVFSVIIGSFAVLPFGLRPWQALFIAGAIPALACSLAMFRMKEPAKWVAARATGALRGVKFGSYRVLLGHPRWSRNAWLGLTLCSAGIIGLWGLGNFNPKIVGSIIEAHVAGMGLAPSELARQQAYWRGVGLFFQSTGGFLGMLAGAKIAQTHGRRFASGLTLVLSFLSTVLVFRFMREISQMYWMLPLMGFGQFTVFGVYAVYLPELFPTSLRSTGTSFCYNFGRMVAASAPFTISRITRSLGGDVEGFRRAGLWVSLVLLAGLVVVPFLPETKGQPLPED